MRVFQGVDGREWQAVVGRESYGVIVAIFLPQRGEDPPRQVDLKAGSMEEALQRLRAMEEGELQALLEEAEAKPLE